KLAASALLLIFGAVATHLTGISPVFCLLIFAVAYIIAAFEVVEKAIVSIVKGEVFNENFLMSVASMGAFIIGQYAEAVFVMLFYGVGELFEHIASDKSRKSIEAISKIRPDTARLVTENGEVTLPAEKVRIGDIISVNPGEIIPLDGVVADGVSSLDTCAVTGESIPFDVAVGDGVYSGCVNINGAIKIRVTAEFKNSTASKILELVQNSESKRAKTQRFITRFAAYYTPVVVILALIVAVIPSVLTKQYSVWIYRALMFLVVSCPCALVVSVPLTYFAAIGAAARQGILIKGGDAVETMSRVKTVVFDKTGTLTKGDFSVVAVHPQKIDERTLLGIAAAAEYYSNHPISLSLKAAYGRLPDGLTVEDVEEIAGHGVRARIGKKSVLVGNDKLMRENDIDFHECHHTGTIVHVAVAGEYFGHIVISDTIKDESKAAVSALKAAGIKTVMLTGDGERQALDVAQKLSLEEYHAHLLPDEKVEKLETFLGKGGKVAFVGDGINDAPVLARADVGVAMGALGSDAAIEAADVVLMDDNPKKISAAVSLSKRAAGIVIQNIGFSIGVKVVIMILSVLGITDMWLASFADVGVLVLAVLNAVRILFKSGKAKLISSPLSSPHPF
ncbi:MAG: cadmium-translocating P-type ATPase, partial [Clostridia bacterium]|nr:cadmium-translocating P-type ATPase [Clostridia bacterium]